ASSGGTGNGTGASAKPDTASFCNTLCGRRTECDHGQDDETCVSECTSANAASLPKLRADLVTQTTGCIGQADCHGILEQDVVSGCVEVAVVSIAPDDATQKFCSAFEAAMHKCGASVGHADCLDLGKRFNEATLADATTCTDKSCNQMAGCVSAVL